MTILQNYPEFVTNETYWPPYDTHNQLVNTTTSSSSSHHCLVIKDPVLHVYNINSQEDASNCTVALKIHVKYVEANSSLTCHVNDQQQSSVHTNRNEQLQQQCSVSCHVCTTSYHHQLCDVSVARK